MSAPGNIMDFYLSLKDGKRANTTVSRQVRDLTLTQLSEDLWMVVACDSDGGIGPKKFDSVYSPAYDLGRLGTRVPLMEILACGAVPIAVVDALAVEMDPTGKEIIRGVKDEVSEAGLDFDVMITGSTEDNVVTVSTGMGVVVIGLVSRFDFRPGRSTDGDVIVSVGLPKSAPEYKITYDDPEIATPETISALTKLEYVHEILPVGSKGIRYEFGELARVAGLAPETHGTAGVDVDKSAGPSTCCLVSLSRGGGEDLIRRIPKPVSIIGGLRK
jgi:selenophosphate synthetase-related protein